MASQAQIEERDFGRKYRIHETEEQIDTGAVVGYRKGSSRNFFGGSSNHQIPVADIRLLS